MMIRFLQRWRRQRAGTVAEWPDGAANVLIKRGVAVLIEDESGYQTGMIEQNYDTRVEPHAKRKGKR